MIVKIVDQTADRAVAYLETPDGPVAEAWGRNAALLFPDSFPNGSGPLVPVRVEKSEVPDAYHAALFRFGEVILPPPAGPSGSADQRLAWYVERNLLRV